MVILLLSFFSSAQLIFGDTNMVVEFKRITVWGTVLSIHEFAQAFASESYTPSGTMIQGWWNYKVTKATQLLKHQLPGLLYSGEYTDFQQ